MPTLTIDGIEVTVESGSTIIQAAEKAGIEIPRFCYHERLHIAGNCRMCLVEVQPGPPKPAASCALPVAEGMVVKTDSEMVKKAREGVMEFLLINHPLDCPICDQGGECDLQDQAMAYGRGYSRYSEHKRAVQPKNMGPLIKTEMTRCIHCTRCVRFMEDVAGQPELGALWRGEEMQITTYLDQAVHSELSGNIIDLCPVGALTSKPYAFQARPWELRGVESIDVMDAVGSNIRVDVRGREVMRVLPRLNEAVNEEWISDKTRFAYDGLKLQRLDRPYVRRHGQLQAASWDEAFAAISDKIAAVTADKIAAIAGNLVDAESMFALKQLMEKLGSPNMDCRQDGAYADVENRASYLFNSTIAGIEDADACLLIGANPRLEASIVNVRLRKRYLKGGFTVLNIGQPVDLTYPVQQLGDTAAALEQLVAGKGDAFKTLKAAKKPMLMVGMSVLTRGDAAHILHLVSKLADKIALVQDGWNGINMLQTAASRVAGLDIGFLPKKGGKDVKSILNAAKRGSIEVVYLLGADELDMEKLGDAFVIYQGHHGDKGAARADVILPGAAYTEKDGTYVNLEGRVQRASRAVTPPGEAKEDWAIIRALSEVLGHRLGYNHLESLRAAMVAEVPHLGDVDQIAPASWKPMGSAGDIQAAAFTASIPNFYMTDAISRASRTMAECTRIFLETSAPRKVA